MENGRWKMEVEVQKRWNCDVMLWGGEREGEMAGPIGA